MPHIERRNCFIVLKYIIRPIQYGLVGKVKHKMVSLVISILQGIDWSGLNELFENKIIIITIMRRQIF